MKTAFNTLDVVRYNATALADNTNVHAKDYIGIVREPSDPFSYIEWYDAKSKVATREITTLHGWVENSKLDRVGSLYHMLVTPTNVLMNTIKKAKAVKDTVVAEVRVKRKYTRKPGSAKPGPKPKKDKAVKPLAAKPKNVKEAVEPAKEDVKEVVVPMPVNKYKKVMDKEWLNGTYQNRYVIAIVGEKPGPSKIQKFKWLGLAMITEEQWLAMIGAPGFKFSTETQDATKEPDPIRIVSC